MEHITVHAKRNCGDVTKDLEIRLAYISQVGFQKRADQSIVDVRMQARGWSDAGEESGRTEAASRR